MDMTELANTKRVWHEEFGRGTVLQTSNMSVTIFWDTPYPGSNTRQMVHDASFAQRLTPIPDTQPVSKWPELRAAE